MRPLLLLLCLLAPAPAAVADRLTVRVVSRDAKGRERGVGNARVSVLPVAGPVIVGEPPLAEAGRTDADGVAVFHRPEEPFLVLATSPGLAIGLVRPFTGRSEVTIVLEAEAMLVGLVLSPDGRPLPGASVIATPETGRVETEFLPPGTLGIRAVTDEAGRFELRGLCSTSRYRVRARFEGFAPATRSDVAPGTEGVALTLLTGAMVRGQAISLPGGTPLSGARVEIAGLAATTDDQGRFEIRGIPPGSWTMAARAESHLYVENRRFTLADEEVREGIFLRLVALGRMKGRILTPTTRPAPGAEILFRYPPDTDLAPRLSPGRIVRGGRSGENGTFDVPGLFPAQGIDLIVRHPDYAPTVHLGYSIVSGRTYRTIVLLREGGVVLGKVLDASGEGVPGARVTALDARESPDRLIDEGAALLPTAVSAVSGEDGAFVLPHVPSGRRTLVAEKEGRLPAVLTGVEVGDGARREGLVLVVGEGAAIAGVVRDAEGNPVAGAVLCAAPLLGAPRTTTSDESGSFAFTGLLAGVHEVSATANGFAPGKPVRVDAPAKDVKLVLRKGAGFTGRVLLEDSREPVAPARIRILVRGESSPLRPNEPVYKTLMEVRAEPPEGRFSAGNLGPGLYRLEAWTEEGLYGFLDGVRVLEGHEALDLEVRVRPGWAVRGRVVDRRTGLPIEGATVALRERSDRPGLHRAVTDGQGRFRLPGVPVGFHTLLAVARDMAPALVRSIEVREATDTLLDDIELAPGPRVSGTVTGPEGERRAGVRIALGSAELRGERSTVTDEEGRFTFENVMPGDYVLRADETGIRRFSRRYERLIEVEPGRDLELSIGSGSGSVLMGRITSGRAPVAYARVTALLATGDPGRRRDLVSVRSDEGGNYVFADLPVGDHLLTVEAPGAEGSPVRFPARVLPGPVTILDLVLPDSGIEGTVFDLDTGDPLPKALLRLTRETGGAAGTFLEALTREMGKRSSDEEGAFRFPALPPGDYRIDAYREGYGQTEVARIRVLPGGFTPVRVEMPPAGVLTGRVLDDRGRPVTTARVRFLDEEGRPSTRDPFVEVDSAGRFRVFELRTGTYTVEVMADGYARHEEAGVEVFPGGSPEVTVRLKIEGRLGITVYGEAGVPLAGARISLVDFWGRPVDLPHPEVGPLTPYRDPALTDEHGYVLVAGLSPGIYTVTARLHGYRGLPVRARVLDGEMTRTAVVLKEISR